MASESGLPVEIDDLNQENPQNLESLLSKFRVDWKKELDDRVPTSAESSARNSPSKNQEKNENNNDLSKMCKEEKAKYFFMEGIKNEESGRVHEAVNMYRRAIQLVPEVESLIDYRDFSSNRKRVESESSVEGSGVEDDLEVDLVYRFHQLQLITQTICTPEWEQRGTHISSLPVEVLMYILKWVITNDLDMHALEKVALVCRGFYLCARDEELWRKACFKIWGKNTGSYRQYGCWRRMFIDRPHLRFNGCYISLASYVRPGEKTLDNFYRQWHTVEYYRYVRFFPEGIILMLTSPEDPVKMLYKLRHRSARPQGMLRGVYRMTDDKITAVLKRVRHDYQTTGYARSKRRYQPTQNDPERTFHVEFHVGNAGSRKCWQLVWKHYSVHQMKRSSREEILSEFDLNKKSYPAMNFSVVKSYTALADKPLQ